MVRGGSVLYEPGTTGGTYVGCYFLGDEGSADVSTFGLGSVYGVGRFCSLELVACLAVVWSRLTDPLRQILPNHQQEVEEAIERSLGVLGIRIYGGHFFVAGGRLDFIGCLFYDMEILTPMTDRLRFGDDIFVRPSAWVFD